MKRLFVGMLAIAMAATFTVAPVTGNAATIEELQALIAQLQAQIAALTGGSTSAGYTFTTDLTVGSTGDAVVKLQQYLVSKGYLTMPAGVAMGYFGPLTKSAVAAWQAANSISPAVGFFGPISRGALNSMMGTTGGTTTGGTTTTGISTPGVEGTITATLNATPGAGTKIYEGDSQVKALGIKLEAKTSDISVERVKVQLPSTTFYNKIASKIYIVDESGNVLASSALNSDTVVKESSNYFITLAGMNFIVPKDSTKVLYVAVDAYGSIDSTYTDGDTFTLTIPIDGVRGIDGAGVNEYSPSGSFSRAITPKATLVDSASLKFSLNANSPSANDVVAADGSNSDELDGLTLLTFDVRAEKDDVKITDMAATITESGVASASTTYIYDGSTLIGSASVSSGTATFSNVDYVVPKDTTKTLTLKVDVRNAASSATTFSAAVTGSSQTAENSVGDTVTPSGSATGETMTIRNVGPQFTLVSRSIEKSATSINANTSTSTAKGTFNVKVTAVGGDIYFGTQSASSTFGFATYKGGVSTTLLVASTTSFTTPSSGVVTSNIGGTNAFELQENNSVTVPVEFLFEGRTTAGALVSTDSYAIGLESIVWSSTQSGSGTTSSFMSGDLDWRTSAVSLP